MIINKINKKTAKEIRDFLETELPLVLSKRGLDFELGNAVFDETSIKFNGFRLKVEGALSEEEKALDAFLDTYSGLDFLDKTKIGHIQGMEVRLVGYKKRARKNPFIIKDIQTHQEYVVSKRTLEEIFYDQWKRA